MSGRGVLFAVDDEELARLGDAADDPAVLAIVAEHEERWEPGATCELEKSWEAIHRALTGGKLDYASGPARERLAILGGIRLVEADELMVIAKGSDEVARVASALAAWDRTRFRTGYYAIDRSEYGDLDEGDLEYAWLFFERMVEFYRDASAAERSVIFSLS